MPKLKSHKGASKRFRTNNSNKVKCRHANRSHINGKCSRSKSLPRKSMKLISNRSLLSTITQASA